MSTARIFKVLSIDMSIPTCVVRCAERT